MLTDNLALTNQPSHFLSDRMTSPIEPPDAESGHGKPEEAAGNQESKSTPSSNKSHQTELFETDIPPWEMPAEASIATATIVFSEAPHGPYDYRVPDSIRDKLKIGMRVHVPLGRRRKPITGWCTKIDLEAKAQRSLRDITEIIDEEPLCDASLVRLVLWMSHYYQAPAGQVFDTLIPSSVRSNAGTREKTYFHPHMESLDDATINDLPKLMQASR